MGSQDVAGVNSTLTSMNTKLDMILARHETSNSNRRFSKRVSCCPPLCSFLLSLLMLWAAHRNTFDRLFVEYRGDILGATINEMVENGTLVQVADRRYKLG